MGPGGVISFTATGSGASVTTTPITATPNADSEFTGWSGVLSGTTNPVTLTMDSDQAVTATFDLLPIVPTYTLTIAVDGTGSGTVTPTVGAHVYDQGEVVTLTTTPDADSEFVGWSGALNGTTSPVTLTMNGGQTITATFELLSVVPTYTLTTIISPTAGGTVTLDPPGEMYVENTVVTMTAVPANGYEFIGWSSDLASVLNPVPITMTQSMTVTANFNQTGLVIYLPLVIKNH